MPSAKAAAHVSQFIVSMLCSLWCALAVPANETVMRKPSMVIDTAPRSIEFTDLNNSTNSIGSALTCNCTKGSTPFCTTDGLCDAYKVATVLRDRASNMKSVIETANVFPNDPVNEQAKQELCHMLRDPVVVDLYLLDHLKQSWIPACLKYSGGDRICSLVPRPVGALTDGQLTAEKINELKHNLHNQLACGQPRFAETKQDVQYCTKDNNCNAATYLATSNCALSLLCVTFSFVFSL